MKEEELRKAADEYTSSDKIRYIQDATDRDVEDAFVEGAEWSKNLFLGGKNFYD